MRRRFAGLKLGTKLLMVITGTSVLALSLACAGFIAYEISAFRARAGRDMDLRAAMLGAGGAPALAFSDEKDAMETLAILRADPYAAAAQFYASDGSLFASYVREDGRGGPPPRPASDGHVFSWERQTTASGVYLAGRRIGTVVLTRDLGEMRRSLAAVLSISLVLLLGSSLTALALAARLQRVISEPILDLTRAAEAIAEQGDYSSRVAARGGDELGVLVAAFNEMLTQIQRRDAALRDSRQRLALLVESTPLGVIVWDPDFRVLEWNPAAERIFGYPPGEASGKEGTFILSERTWTTQVKAVWEDLLARRGGSRFTNENVAKDGRTIICDWYNTPLVGAGDKVIAVASMVDDVTERKRAQDELRSLTDQLERRVAERTAELLALNKELETFCYSVSHDLRAPLRAINGFSSLLLANYSGRLDAEGKDHLARTAAAARRMSEIIDDLLDLSRVTRTAMRPVPVDLGALARDIAGQLQAREPERRVDVVIDAGAPALGDPSLLRLLLENLLSNAWKFTSRTAAPRVEVRARREGGRTVYSVRDNGAGFDPAYADKLFKPFSRLHTEGEFAGTGVGLATAARIIERHGGRIWAEGAVGLGAAFHFILPET
ncbi:MAG: PAS domain S-box protein [Elusimicrobia bacterium]|nr:PAS domain S-box protein [Elusimicrobiota bacterium]